MSNLYIYTECFCIWSLFEYVGHCRAYKWFRFEVNPWNVHGDIKLRKNTSLNKNSDTPRDVVFRAKLRIFKHLFLCIELGKIYNLIHVKLYVCQGKSIDREWNGWKNDVRHKIDLILSDSTKNSHWKLYSASLERQMALSHPVLVHGRVPLAYVILWWCQ